MSSGKLRVYNTYELTVHSFKNLNIFEFRSETDRMYLLLKLNIYSFLNQARTQLKA